MLSISLPSSGHHVASLSLLDVTNEYTSKDVSSIHYSGRYNSVTEGRSRTDIMDKVLNRHDG